MSTSTATAYRCCNDERLAAVRARDGLNGIEAVELIVPAGELVELPQSLEVVFVKPIAAIPPAEAFRIVGGSRGRGLTVTAVAPTHDPSVVRVELEAPGDLNTYELRLVDPAAEPNPPPGIDPVLARCEFSFSVVCETDVDCLETAACAPVTIDDPRIDRLGRDYPGFRRVLLDRMAKLHPNWQQRNPADVRVALVEALAYIGDQLSYEQDAIATEAYLGTARHRVSARRHARLVDYRMHDGLSSRTFLQLLLDDAAPAIPAGPTEAAAGTFLTGSPGDATSFDASDTRGRRRLAERRRSGSKVFHIVEEQGVAAVAPSVFTPDHNRMSFYTWSGDDCCLPAGATRATLDGSFPDLAVDDVLIISEHLDPQTLVAADADPQRRYPVRLRRVEAGAEGAPLLDPATDAPITEIEWHAEDALPVATMVAVDGTEDVAVALGNIVLVEHGYLESTEQLTIGDPSRPWRPMLAVPSISQSAPPPVPGESARAMQALEVDDAQAHITLVSDDATWHPTRDLIGTGDQNLFVAEVDNDERVSLRFGRPEPDGTFRHGRTPTEVDGTATMAARYRTGFGPAGNVGADAIRLIVNSGEPETDLSATLRSAVAEVTNPLAAWGGRSLESIEHVRQVAPFAFNVQERAVTADDYARRAEQFHNIDVGGVQQAIAQLRWTGAWYTVFVAVDRVGGVPVDDEFETALRDYLDTYRMAGHDIEIEGAVDVPLEVELEVQLVSTAFRSVVLDEIRDVLSNRRLIDGRLGLFHPDRLTFAQTVYLSPILAEVQSVAGVTGVRVTRFGPYRQPAIELRDVGYLEVGRNEIARLDGDPSRPDRGVLDIAVVGGR